MPRPLDSNDPNNIMDNSAHNSRESNSPPWYPASYTPLLHPNHYNSFEPPEMFTHNPVSTSSPFDSLLPASSDSRQYQQHINSSHTPSFSRSASQTRSRLFQALTGTNFSAYSNSMLSNTQDISIDTLRSREDEEPELALLSYHQSEFPSDISFTIDRTQLPPVHRQFQASSDGQQNQNRRPLRNSTPAGSRISRPPYTNRSSLNSNLSMSNALTGQGNTTISNYQNRNSVDWSSRSVNPRPRSPYLSQDSRPRSPYLTQDPLDWAPSPFLSDFPDISFGNEYEQHHIFRNNLQRDLGPPSQTVSNIRETSNSNNTTYAPRINLNSDSVVLPPIFMPNGPLPSSLSKQDYYMAKSSKQQVSNKSVSWIRNGVRFEGETFSLRNLLRREPTMRSSCAHCKVEMKICNVDVDNNRVSAIMKDGTAESGARSTQLWEGAMLEGPTCTTENDSPTTELYNITKYWQQLHPNHSLSNNHNRSVSGDRYSVRKAQRYSLSSYSNSCQQLPPISYCESGNDADGANRMLAKAKSEYVWLLLTKVDTGRVLPSLHRSHDYAPRLQNSPSWQRKKVQMLVSIRRSDGSLEGCIGKNRVDMKLLYAQPDRFAQQGGVADIRLR